MAGKKYTYNFIMDEKQIELVSSSSNIGFNIAAVKPVSVRTLLFKYATRKEKVVFFLGFLCIVHYHILIVVSIISGILTPLSYMFYGPLLDETNSYDFTLPDTTNAIVTDKSTNYSADNEALNLRVNTLTNKLTEKEEEIDDLKEENSILINELKKWKNKFIKIINFIKNKLLRPKDNEKYNEFTIDLYTHKTIDQETFDDIRNNYSKDKRKDDFER